MGKTPNPSIEGTILDDLIALLYTDGDMVTNGSENVFAFSGNDHVEAGGGADTLLTLTTGDTITFEGITEAAFEAEFFGP